MSIPKIGFTDEVIGKFECDILKPNLNNEENLIFQIDEDSLIIENKYFKKLYDDSVIDLILSVDCFNVYKELKTSVKNENNFVEYPRKDAGGKFVISIYFVATKDFKLDTKNNNFSSFYNEEYSITKGQIVSKVITKHIDINLTSTNSSFKFLSVVKNPNLKEDDFKIRLEDEYPELSIKSEDTFFEYDSLRKRKFRGSDKIADAILLGPLFVELIRIIIEDRLEGEKYGWAEALAIKMGYNSLDELEEQIQDENMTLSESFQAAYNIYATRMLSKNYFNDLFKILKEI